MPVSARAKKNRKKKKPREDVQGTFLQRGENRAI